MTIKTDISELKKAVEYNTKLIEELTMMLNTGQEAKQALVGQMGVLKAMFANLPGLSPDLKKGMEQIFDKAGK